MKTFSMTDTGKIRQTNQDFICSMDEPVGNLPNLFIVADGMGGHRAGDFASKYAVERVTALIKEDERKNPQEIIETAIKTANRELFELSAEDPEKNGMGTTFVGAVIDDGTLFAFNVGDSRLYVINHRIEQVTQDHSYVQEMVKNGELRQKDTRNHPRKNIITRAVGVSPVVEVDFFKRPLSKGDGILICSDGLSNMLEDLRIEQLLKTGVDPIDKVERLINAANENGGTDNISVVYIDY